MENLDLILQQYVATANNPEYNLDWDVINSKFPELAEYDPIALQQYVATANNPKYGKDWGVINAKFPELGYGVIEKPKTAKEAIQSVSNIRKSIDENDPEVINDIARKYFSLDNMPEYTEKVKTTATGLQGATTTTIDVPREPTDEEMKEYFKNLQTGGFEKYEQYKEYQDTKVFNLDWVDESTKSNAVEYRQKQKTHEYIGTIDNDEVRESAEIAVEEGVYDIFEPNEGHWQHRYTQALKEDRKATEEYEEITGDVIKYGFDRFKYTTKKDSKASAVLVEYMKDKQKHLSRDSFNWENDYNNFVKIQDKYQGEIDTLKKELDALGDVDEYSSPETIAKYNEIAAKQNSIIKKFNQETKGLNIMERHTDLMSRVEKHEKAISKITDADAVAKAFALNYNIGSRADLHLEKAFMGSMAGMGFGALNLIAGISEGIVETVTGEEANSAVTDYFQNTYAAHIDYQESLDNHMQSTLPLNIPWKDVGLHNIGEVSGQLLANNIFSIGSALTYGGAIKAGINVPLATNMLTGTFFLVEGGAKLSEMEIAQKNAAENIAILEEALPFAITQDERLAILEQISAQDKALNVTQVQKAFSTILYGGIAAYAERLGTMGYVRRLNTMIKAASRPSIMNAIKGTGAFTLNSGIEYVEEFVTQVGHNLTDVAVLGQNKSLIAGIDAEFNMNVLFSTFAIQAPSTGRNIYNSVSNEISSRKEIAKDRKRQAELIDILHTLKQDDKFGGLKPEMRAFLETKRDDILRAAGVRDSYTFANAAQMTRSEIDALFEKQAKKRDKMAEMRDLGASATGETEESNYIKRQRKILTGDINQLDNEIDELLLKPEQRNKKTVEEVLGKENVQAETEFYFGKYQAAKQIGKGLGNQQVFKDDIEDGKRVEGSGIAKLETYLNKQLKKGNIDLQFKNDALAGAKRGNYALHIGNTVVLMEDNIINSINSEPSSLVKSIIAYAPFHELQHINDIATGLVKSGDVIETQKAVVAGIKDHIENLHKRGKIKDTDYNSVKTRIDKYTKNNGGNVNLKELLTIAGELKDAGILSQESRDPLLSMKILLNKFIRRNFGDREMFFKLKDTDQVLQYIDSFQRGVRGSRLMLGPEEKVEKVNFSEVYQEVDAMYNEEAWADPKKKSDLALQMAYTLIPEVIRRMQNVKLDKYVKEDLAINFATSDQRGLFGLIKKYDKEINDSVMGYLNSFVTTNKGKFKLLDLRLMEFYQNDPKYGNLIQSMEQEGVGAQVAKMTDETNLDNALEDDTKKPKVNILKVGKVAGKEQAIIKAVNEKGDFRKVIDNNVGTVGNIIFNIPAKKIADPTANITTSDKIIDPKTGKPVKKGERGILEPSEAKSIQDHFADINTTKKFIQLLNLTNVTEKDADVNKVGENIEVSRDVYGRAIGLPRRVLDYFYRPKFKSDGKRVRSQGKTSQVPIWELKPEFRGLNDEQLTKAAEQFQKDLGITEKQQVNKLPTKANRSKIGQLLKGAAVVVSQQASLSAAQRKLEAAKAEKQRIADITAAQPKVAFSEVMRNVDSMHEGVINTQFEGDLNRIDRLLNEFIDEGTFKHGDQTEIDNYFEQLETVVLGNMPKNMFGKDAGQFYSFIKRSKRVLPNKGENIIELKSGKQVKVNNYFDIKRTKLNKKIKAGKVKFGKPFKGKGAEYVYGKTYSQMFGGGLKSNDPNLPKKIKESFYDGTREKYNKIHSSMHRQFMERVNESIRSNPKNAKVWGNYFSFVGQDTKHPFRMGAEWVLFSENPIGADGKLYEWEHAMMATRAYLYLLQTSLDKVHGKYFDFDLAYDQVMENYKLIALDNYDDKKKLGDSGRQKTMGEDWSFFENWWGDRYFDEVVAAIEGKNGYGINPKSLMGENRKSAAEIYNINAEGKPRPLKTGIAKVKKLNTAIQKARTLSFSEVVRGMSAWDLDDTLARTKSGVWYILPNPEGTPQPGRKVIFLAGGPGAGKSNVVKQLGLRNQGFNIVNSDISLEWLKKNSGLPADMKDLTHEELSKLGKLQHESRQIALRKKMKFQGKGDGIVVDGTGASLNVMKQQVQEFKDKGYDVQMVFVETSLDVAQERNEARKVRSLTTKIVETTWNSVTANKEAYKELFGKNFSEVNTDKLKQNDPMPAGLVAKVDKFTKGYIKGRLLPGEYADKGADLATQGATFDFTEFDQIIEGEQGPLFGKALNRAKKYGLKDQFILTARPHAAQIPIYEFLKSQGLHIPLKNIVTLENSAAEAKALWIAEKVGEGYNDIYFADDAMQNVQAVQNMLNQFDVKGKVQQAKINFSESINQRFNDILEDVTGIDSKKRFSAIKARKRGADKGKFRFFIPPSHEDFVGLIYNFLGKGKKGNAHRNFFEQALVKPLNRAYRELNTAKQAIANDYKSLNKEFKNVRKKLIKKTPDGDFTYQDAIRVYLWDKHGHKVPGLNKTDQQNLVDLVMADSELQMYAETLSVISKQETYVKPSETWETGDIRVDLDDATGRVGREEFFTEFFENADIIFSEENLNKIEAAYGEDVVSAIKDILYRTKTGRNRPSGQNKLVNGFLNYLNGSVASTMFFNMRSAVLQQMSMVNFINFADNNIYAAAKAFANLPQYYDDWAFIFNSDFMKQRRRGIQTDVNGAELAASLKGAKNTPRALLAKLLELGFLPTQIGDNMAIATGGATFYRNRINTYLKQGLSQKEAQEKAWIDFQILAEATQQSARPDMVSQQQASPLGKVILAFQNVTSQFNRLGKKAFLDIKNRRITPGNTNQFQSDVSNLSRISYYFVIQNLIFYSLQSALFMAMFDDDEDDERWLKKKERVINGSIDSVLRGTGVWGAVIATLKNMAIKWHKQRGKGYNADESAVLMEMLNVSPPLGIKARKLVNAEKTLNYNKKVIDEMDTFDIDNPMWSAVTNYIEATTNAPLNRMHNKTQNVRQSLNNQHEALQRVLMFGGWSQWNLGIPNKKIDLIKEQLKLKSKLKKKKKSSGTTGRKTVKRKTTTR